MLTLTFEDRAYEIDSKFEIICEIEEELGAVSELVERFARDKWAISELVTIIHIILSSVGRNVDYVELGNKILKEGVSAYLKFIKRFLTELICK